MLAVLALICVGLLGASLFATGIIFSMTALTVPGIVLLALNTAGMVLWYVYHKPPTQIQIESQGPVAYTTNNMNTMKRNKSDTDLELIGQDP